MRPVCRLLTGRPGLPTNKSYLATDIWSAVLLGVSIIIVNYNMSRFVGEAIKSGLEQDHPLVEIIVVDDGSTDDSSKIISSHADRARILLLEENIGQVSALCRAWPLARHPVVVFLDSDDLMLPHAAARLAATFAATTARVQFCLQTIDDAGRPLDHFSPKYPDHLDTKTIRSELLRTGSSPAAQGSGNAYAKWMLEKVEQDNGFEMPAEKRMAMDAAMEVNAAFYGEVLTLREPLGCYRIHASNVTGHLTVSHRRFVRTIDKFDLKLAYLQQRCQVWGIDFDPDAARQRALPVFECRLAAAKLDPQSAPDAGPLALFWPALRACATSTYSLRQSFSAAPGSPPWRCCPSRWRRPSLAGASSCSSGRSGSKPCFGAGAASVDSSMTNPVNEAGLRSVLSRNRRRAAGRAGRPSAAPPCRRARRC